MILKRVSIRGVEFTTCTSFNLMGYASCNRMKWVAFDFFPKISYLRYLSLGKTASSSDGFRTIIICFVLKIGGAGRSVSMGTYLGDMRKGM